MELYMDKIVFTPQEIEQIKTLQEKYNMLGIQLVQLKLAKRNGEDYIAKLNAQEAELEQQIIETNTEERQLAQQFDDKYGAGSLDIESGEFTPNQA